MPARKVIDQDQSDAPPTKRGKKMKSYDATARRLAAQKIGPIDLPLRKGAWQTAKERGKIVPGQPKTKSNKKSVLAVNNAVLVQMAHDREGGKTYPQLSREYGLSEQYVRDALAHHYVSLKDGKQALRGVLLEGAVACAGQAKKKIDELNGMQSVVAAGIFTQRFIDMDKHIQESPEDVDMADVEKAGALIRSLETEQEGVLLEDENKEASIDLDADEE